MLIVLEVCLRMCRLKGQRLQYKVWLFCFLNSGWPHKCCHFNLVAQSNSERRHNFTMQFLFQFTKLFYFNVYYV